MTLEEKYLGNFGTVAMPKVHRDIDKLAGSLQPHIMNVINEKISPLDFLFTCVLILDLQEANMTVREMYKRAVALYNYIHAAHNADMLPSNDELLEIIAKLFCAGVIRI